MALIKDIETPQAVVGSYHKIVKIEMFAAAESLQVTMAIYASAEARDAGAKPLWYDYVTVPIAALTSDPRASVYPVVAGYWDSYLKDASADQTVPPAPLPIELTEAATEPPAPPPPTGD